MKIHYNCDSAIKHKWTAKCYLIFLALVLRQYQSRRLRLILTDESVSAKKIYIALHTVY